MLRVYLNLFLGIFAACGGWVAAKLGGIRLFFRGNPQDSLPFDQLEPKIELHKSKESLIDPVSVVIINDQTTSINFVIDVLMQSFRLSKSEASEIAIRVHFKGHGTVEFISRNCAKRVLAYISNEAKKRDYPLECQIQ